MALTNAQVKTAIIIGKYGGCLPVCEGGAMITGTFNLAGCKAEVVVVGTAGAIPMVPGEIQNLYQPVADQPGWYTRRDDLLAEPRRLVKVKVTFQDTEYEKYLLLTDRKAYYAVRAMNFINSTQERVNATVTQFSHATTRTVVEIKNFVKKWWN